MLGALGGLGSFMGGLMAGPVGAVAGVAVQVAQEAGKAIGQAVQEQQSGETQPAGGQAHQDPFHQILQDLR